MDTNFHASPFSSSQPFALYAARPRCIAWLVHDDWKHIERLVKLNCALLGGYYNAFILLEKDGSLSTIEMWT
ncbi:hypothetical protein IAD21_05436 [Abditibacteriota bacterium]|nr:hypothetical protein IAD21_05436 [Abditibacteriota bacterium]